MVLAPGRGWSATVSLVPSIPAPPRSPGEAAYRAAVRDLAQGRLDDADAAFRESLAQEPGQIASLLGQALVAQRRGRVREAETHLKRALAQEPVSVPAQLAWARWLAARRQWAKAEAALRRIVTAHPDLIPPRLDLGDLYGTVE
jgi:predicted Zn-dependent protease